MFVEGHDKLPVLAVTVHNQQVFEEDGRASRSLFVVDDQILVPPQDPARVRRQTGRPHGAVMDVNAARFDDRAGGRMRVLGIDPQGIGRGEDLQVALDLSRVEPGADCPKRMSLLSRRGEPESGCRQ